MYNVMAMKSIVGNEKTVAYLGGAVKSGNLSHAYLFCGPESVGKTKVGKAFARLILCEGDNPVTCTECPSCKLFAGGSHPDFFLLDQGAVVVDDIRELTNSLELRPYRGRGKVALLSHAENLTNQALNAFLKTLEEPTSQTTIILTTENKRNLLPTIVSRSRIVNFGLAPGKQIFEFLNGDRGVKKEEATKICKLAAGRVGVAVSLSEDDSLAAGMQELVAGFNRAYHTQDIYEKISYADVLSKDKESLISKLQTIELSTRGELMKSSIDQNYKAKTSELIALMDRIAMAKDMISKNANAKLVIEGLLLGSML